MRSRLSYGSPVVVDRIPGPALARRIMLHEAEAQQTPDRRLRDLGDGWLLHDAADAEPFWTRLIAPRWPAEQPAFDRRLDEVVTLFATLDRLPHVRPAPIGTEPPDLADRLVAFGFDVLASDRRMVLRDEEPCRSLAAAWRHGDARGRWPASLSIARHAAGELLPPPDRRRWSEDASLVLGEAFAVDPLRRSLLEGDARACVARPGCLILLLHLEGEPVAVARLATSGDGGYLSSIGVRPAWRRRGLGALATAVAVTEALDTGAQLIHLAVDVDNADATRLYEGLGFAVVGEPAPDLLLR
jgi:ribosomal protein S18 acetylase RimI-like enzyme